jgi:DNA-binding response OmpR family regulator
MTERLNILLAEDESNISRLIRQVLTNAGHTVTGVRSAGEAIESLAFGSYDLVLLDLHLADGDGFRVVATLEQKGQPSPPVVLMTGEGTLDLDDPRTVRVAGILNKPFDVDELERTVNRFIA